MNAPRAVLWDMDGTIIDSEEFHWISWRETMAAEGIQITHLQFLSTFGLRNDSIIPAWIGANAPAERIEKIGNAKEQLYRHLVRTKGISPLPGVATWLPKLHEQGWLQAIVSSAPRLNIEVILDVIDATRYFQSIVSAEDVRKGKPDPEVYLMAASRLGIPPGRCIVIEDAAAGIEGARRAGMRSIGVGQKSQNLAADIATESLALLDSTVFDSLLQRDISLPNKI